MSSDPCKVIRTNREILENKLLVGLNDHSKVAILATRDDLDLFIRGMRALSGDAAAEQFARDMEQLREAAFGE